jgi:bacteriocin-like protein
MTSNILTETELENITGGVNKKIKFMKVSCKKCSKNFEVNMDVTIAKCPFCKTLHTFEG